LISAPQSIIPQSITAAIKGLGQKVSLRKPVEPTVPAPLLENCIDKSLRIFHFRIENRETHIDRQSSEGGGCSGDGGIAATAALHRFLAEHGRLFAFPSIFHYAVISILAVVIHSFVVKSASTGDLTLLRTTSTDTEATPTSSTTNLGDLAPYPPSYSV